MVRTGRPKRLERRKFVAACAAASGLAFGVIPGGRVGPPRPLTARCALPARAIRRANYVHNVVDTP